MKRRAFKITARPRTWNGRYVRARYTFPIAEGGWIYKGRLLMTLYEPDAYGAVLVATGHGLLRVATCHLRVIPNR